MTEYTIRKILIPVDLSDTSLNALDTATAIAKIHGAEVRILNVLEPLLTTDDAESPINGPQKTNEAVLGALTGTIGWNSGLEMKLIQKKGNVVESIITTSRTENADLIVMGTHGASGFRANYMGSNAYNIIKYASCPVLTIPPQRRITSFKNVLFPVRPVSGALMTYDIASRFLSRNSALEILGLSNPHSNSMPRILDKLVEEASERFGIEHIYIKTSWGKGDSIAEDILQYAQQNNSELIIITSGLDGVNKPNFIGPHSQRIINSSRTPLLIIKRSGIPMLA